MAGGAGVGVAVEDELVELVELELLLVVVLDVDDVVVLEEGFKVSVHETVIICVDVEDELVELRLEELELVFCGPDIVLVMNVEELAVITQEVVVFRGKGVRVAVGSVALESLGV